MVTPGRVAESAPLKFPIESLLAEALAKLGSVITVTGEEGLSLVVVVVLVVVGTVTGTAVLDVTTRAAWVGVGFWLSENTSTSRSNGLDHIKSRALLDDWLELTTETYPRDV